MTQNESTRRTVVKAIGGGVVGIGAIAQSTSASENGDCETIEVGPEKDQQTIQSGVDEAEEGDIVLIHRGTYKEEVDVDQPNITIRGRNRNAVELDGETEKSYGFKITADGVAVENLRVHHYTDTGVYWNYVEGFRASYVTAHNNREYGLYARTSYDGRFERCYASGSADAGFYLGHNNPFNALITHVVAEGNGLGYSGTEAGGELMIKDSTWRNNWAGIVPNTLHGDDETQFDATITGNRVIGNNNVDAPALPIQQIALGTGILLVGASENTVRGNQVNRHENFGIAIAPFVAHEPPILSNDNIVKENLVQASREVASVTPEPEVAADLAIAEGAGEGNRFENNNFRTSLPEGIEDDPSEGSELVSQVYLTQMEWANEGKFDPGDWRTYTTGQEKGRPTMSQSRVRGEPVPAGRDHSIARL